jgi:hypothetical protein
VLPAYQVKALECLVDEIERVSGVGERLTRHFWVNVFLARSSWIRSSRNPQSLQDCSRTG